MKYEMTRRGMMGATAACGLFPDLASADEPSLQEIAHKTGRRFGCSIGPAVFQNPQYGALVARECGIFVNEQGLGWFGPTDPVTPNFQVADQLLAFAEQRQIPMRGHPLVWPKTHQAVPGQSSVQKMVDHITAVITHFGPKVGSWDVVNEAVLPPDGRPDLLRLTPMLDEAGPDYLVTAFKTARACAPQAELVYNDWVDGFGDRYWEQRRTGILKLIEMLKSKGAPIDAIGLESHLTADRTGFSPIVWVNFCKELAGMGVTVHITELNIADDRAPADITARDQTVADTARRYLDLTLSAARVHDVIVWGMCDKYSSLARYSPRKDGLETRGTPYDDDLKAKPLRQAIAQSLAGAPKI